MQLIRGLNHLETLRHGCVLTMGNFDGVHLGHQQVIFRLAELAQQLNLPSCVMLFEPQPLEFFLNDNAPPRLTRLREKAIQLSRLPVDEMLVLEFNQRLANYPAEAFIDEILVNRLNVKHLVIGDDFHFGKKRRGNFAMLQAKGREHGFSVEATHSFEKDEARVSSTLIRDALQAGDLVAAKRMLGRDYSVCGRVAQGEQLGRKLGFPTANVEMFRKNTALIGVFAVTMTGIDGQEYQGVANVGTRPTVDGSAKVILETHLFNFDRNIYGHYVEVHFKHKLRDERRFPSVAALMAQIHEDTLAAQQFFAGGPC